MHFKKNIVIITISHKNKRCATKKYRATRRKMKIAKKIISLFICLTVIFASGCFGGETIVSNMFASSYWLTNTDSDVGEINETSVYSLSFVSGELEEGESNVLESDLTGTFTTTIEDSSYNGTKCYKFTTHLKASGTYTYGDKSAPINDETISTVYFLGISSKFFPLYSEKSVKTICPIKNSGFTFAQLDYNVTTTYDKEGNSATVKVVSNIEDSESDSETQQYAVQNSERTYEKLGKNGTVLDNESLIFIPRASDLLAGFSSSFCTIDALSQKIHRMQLMVSSTSPTSEVNVGSYTIDGQIANPIFNCFNATMSIADTFSGSAIKLYYSADAKTHGKRLVKMETALSYSLGTIIYTLQSVTHA